MTKLLTIAATLLLAAPAHANWNTAWGKAAGQRMCTEMKRGQAPDTAAEIAMNSVLASPALKADFVQFVQMSGGIAQMNSEIEMMSGLRAACPQYAF